MDSKKPLHEKELLSNIVKSFSHPFLVINTDDYTIEFANSHVYDGKIGPNMKCYEVTHNIDSPCSGENHICPLIEIVRTKKPLRVEHIHYDTEGNIHYMEQKRSYFTFCII